MKKVIKTFGIIKKKIGKTRPFVFLREIIQKQFFF